MGVERGQVSNRHQYQNRLLYQIPYSTGCAGITALRAANRSVYMATTSVPKPLMPVIFKLGYCVKMIEGGCLN